LISCIGNRSLFGNPPANRTLTVLKAALNHAYHEGRVSTDEAWRKVKPFREADAPIVHFLSDDESRRIVNACDGAFRNIVKGALLTFANVRGLSRPVPMGSQPLPLSLSPAGTAAVAVTATAAGYQSARATLAVKAPPAPAEVSRLLPGLGIQAVGVALMRVAKLHDPLYLAWRAVTGANQ